jgi:Cof subfamily protein (haloacid dehalogenase superfamily)
MKRDIKAVFFDIDGTLVSFRTHEVPDSARRAIERLRERGIKVFIATGRLLCHTDAVGDLEVDGYVTVNGGCCLTSSGEIIYEEAFPQSVLDKVFALEERYGFQSALMTQKNMYVDHYNPSVQTIADMIKIYPEVADRREVAKVQPVLQMCPYVRPELESEIMEHLPECVPSRWIDLFMDINIKGIDKSVGARKVMEYYGLTMQEAMAFGDGGNDLPLIRDVAVGVAMGNACEELKAEADYITSSVDEDGVSRALEYFELI